MQLQKQEQAAAESPITLVDQIDESVRRGDYTPEAGLILKALHKLESNPTASDVARHKVMTEAFLRTPTQIGRRLH